MLHMMHSLPTEIIIADTHPLFREAVEARVSSWYPRATIRQAESAVQLQALLAEVTPQLLITDLHLPPGDLLDIIRDHPAMTMQGILIYSNYRDPKVVRDCCKMGVLGYVHKTSGAELLHKAIKSVLRREVFLGPGISLTGHETPAIPEGDHRFKDYFQLRFELTKRELEVLGQIKRGLNNREIAEALFISEQTVCVHRKNILRKVGVNNTQKLLRITYEHHLA